MDFGELMRHYRQARGYTQADLAHKLGLSDSTISLIERGQRGFPRTRQWLTALADALGLNVSEKQALFDAAGVPISSPLEAVGDPIALQLAVQMPTIRTRRQSAYQVFQALLEAPYHFSPEQLTLLEQAILAMLRPSIVQSLIVLDEILGDVMARSGEYDVQDLLNLLEMPLEQTWEIKRRIAVALPELVAIEPARTVALAYRLRDDPGDPLWRTDIRRRVIEATPALYPHDPGVMDFLRWREGDEVYAAMAILEVGARLDPAGQSARLDDLLSHFPGEQDALHFLADLLSELEHPPQAMARIAAARQASNLIKIGAARTLPHLLPYYPQEVMDTMVFFLRRPEGIPLEHQNVRRAAARSALASLWERLDEAQPRQIFRLIAQEPDLHTRRALSDYLPRLAGRWPDMARELAETLTANSQDPYLHNRALKVRLRLARIGH